MFPDSSIFQNDTVTLDVLHRGEGLHPDAHPPQNTTAVPHGLFDGHAHAGHLAARLGDEFRVT